MCSYMYKCIATCINVQTQHLCPQVNNNNVRWSEFVSHWALWSVYIAHFSMNWSNYIIMQWLPTYLTRSLGASHSHIMFTAVPYLMNSVVGVGKSGVFTTVPYLMNSVVSVGKSGLFTAVPYLMNSVVGAGKSGMFTAVPYLMNCVVGIGKSGMFTAVPYLMNCVVGIGKSAVFIPPCLASWTLWLVLVSLLCSLPWYNCKGWLGVKHQVTYVLWCVHHCALPHELCGWCW